MSAAEPLSDPEPAAEAYACAGRSLHFPEDHVEAYEWFSRAYLTSSDRERKQRALWGRFLSALFVDDLDPKEPISEYAKAARSSGTELLRLHQARLSIAGREGGLHAAI